MSTANPVPSYRRERPRSIFGPLILVALGIALLLGTTGVISFRYFFTSWFPHYWPVLLILWGIAKFVEYLLARQKGYPPPRLGAGSIVFLIFFILFGITATRLSGVNWKGIGQAIDSNSDVDTFDFFGSGYDFTDNFAAPVTDASQIRILSDRGDITVTTSADNQAHAIIHKTLRGDSQGEADRLNVSTHPKFQQQGSIWIMDLTGGDYQRGRFNLDLQLPRSAALSVSTRVGNINVSGRNGNLDASSEHGDVSVDQITGDASLRLKHGNLTASNVSGNVSVDGTVNESNISGVGGMLTLNGSYWGEMQLSHIAKQVHFISSRTDLQFARLDGDFNMEPDELRANGITGPFKLDTKSKTVHLEDVSGDVHIDDKNATIEVRSKAPLGNIDLSSVHGEIDVTLPSAAGFQLDAQSVGGEIQSEFNVNVDNQGTTATARGTVGKGGPAIRLKADHGTIQIRKQ